MEGKKVLVKRGALDWMWIAQVTLYHVGGLTLGHAYFTPPGFRSFWMQIILIAPSVTIGFHRMFTHGGFQTYRPIRYAFAIFGGLAESSLLEWVARHRIHHKYSDCEGDPHGAHEGFWHAHVGWLFNARSKEEVDAEIATYAPDLQKDPVLVFLQMYHGWMQIGNVVLLLAVGAALGGTHMAMSFFVWGFMIRKVVLMHTTWMVNSWCHTFGYRTYETRDTSTNSMLVGILALGEGFHNNHHYDPTNVRHGRKWYEFDTSYWLIRLMQALGFAWNIKEGKMARLAKHL
jgi:stearoyl-CoA desaturase (Delta-9 desaturase)